ncbi:MAG: alkaline phosphatase family protein [Flavobacteriia bacterium]|nr:MAG: alkaline phosphatase family protein [Flavobacteriia bacterium]
MINKTLFIFLIIWLTNFYNTAVAQQKNDFVIAFGSCDNQEIENKLWNEILKNHPDIFIWGGDVIYSDTEDMPLMLKNYNKQKNDSVYLNFTKKTEILSTWDDHDFGANDAGKEYPMKDTSQQLFLNFFDVKPDDVRRKQKGVYFSKDFIVNKHKIRIILLDTRYFRSALTRDHKTKKRYKPNKYGEGTMLGDKQWRWLKEKLYQSDADFNIIMSSIQFLSYEHGFETWGNMPHEVDKLERIISGSKAKGVIILSGDRHIAEISSKKLKNVPYPLIDFTSSGMTHSYTAYKGEPNKYRLSKVVPKKNFGVLKFDLSARKVTMEIRGEGNVLYEKITQKY